MYNPEGDFYVIQNAGAFENRGTLENGGRVLTACGAAFYGSGATTGVPVDYEQCEVGSAIQLLTSRTYELSSWLPKTDVRTLTEHLAGASKALALFSDRVLAEAEMRAFIQAMDALSVTHAMPDYISRAVVAWAERVVVILVS